jgi:dehydrogenase/reductase SDR family protein 7B
MNIQVLSIAKQSSPRLRLAHSCSAPTSSTKNLTFYNKIIWITGASSGIGSALARHLAAQGARLILSSRRIEKLEQLRTELVNSSQHQVFQLDLEQPEALYTRVQNVISDWGPIDILINNAGIAQRSRVLETQLAVDRRIMEINFFGTVAMTKAILPSMVARGTGQIMTVGSVAGKIGSQTRSSYSASKHALNGYMDSLRAEVWHSGVHVQLACPGWVNTDIGKGALDGNGNALADKVGTIDFGISAEDCAQGIATALLMHRDETIIGRGWVRMAPALKRIFPSLVNRIMRRKVYR